MTRFTAIGSGDAFGTHGKRQTSFLIEWSDMTFLIDCGATTLNGLKKLGFNPFLIDFIIISHLHGDHIGGIPFLLTERAYSNEKKEKLTIIGPKECSKRLMDLQELMYPGTRDLVSEIVEIKEFGEIHSIDGLSINNMPVNHSELSNPNGIRLTFDNKSIAYSGDGDWSDNLVQLSQNTELFICECFNYKESTKGHLSYETLKEKLSEFSSKQIYLTHPGPEMMENIDKIDVPFLEDGFSIDF